MIRMTRPHNAPATKLPPVVFPGGLAANLVAMARHQDLLTQKYGFTVVNFDRLGVGFSDPYDRSAKVSPSAYDVARELNYVINHCGVDPEESWIQVPLTFRTEI
jgi:pimeloyl-ACP methyl ester carboxylesterase